MNKKGFTLTELIAVIAIIGIVLLIVIPVTNTIMKDNDKEKGMAYVQTLEDAVNTYCDMYGVDEVTYDDLINEKLIISSTDVSLEETLPFVRIEGKVSIKGEEGLSVDLAINNKHYTCTKTSCELNKK